LIRQLCDSGRAPREIAHLWSVSPDRDRPVDLELFEAGQETGFYSLLFLARALAEQNLTDAIQITVISNNLQRVTGRERICPEKATLLGACKVIPQEYSNLRCRQIDISVSDLGDMADPMAPVVMELLNQLTGELGCAASEPVLAYRDGKRFV